MTDAQDSAVTARKNAGAPQISLDWFTRPVFGVLLGALAVIATIAGGIWFAIVIGAAAIAAAREWHRMFTRRAFTLYFVVTSISIVAALAGIARIVHTPATFPWVVLMAGTVVNFTIAALRKADPSWQAFGVLYVGIAAVALVGLRLHAGFWPVLILFATVWATDTGALISGNLIGGPKFAPVLSPNKTWAGFFGGIVFASVTGAIILALINGGVLRGALFGAGVALAAHMGDLFESWVKRRVGRKNSGSLIPGHGGVLDRIDSLLLAAPVCALVICAIGVDPILGMQP
ncbi:MAG TPA: phosphatidate cytidylyltransferase [Rhizomicrobium sp.]|nr:phosphatidate cytidylyltransferase [Rhizomicrobium sp.]